MNKLFTIGCVAAFCGTFAAAQQVGCLATTSSVTGTYTYVATEMPMSGVAIAPPGTTTGSQTYSNTPVGQFVSALNAGNPFSMAGVLYFDGAGHVNVSTAAAPLAASTPVGSYTVNSDCTISVTLTDVFNTATPTAGVTIPTFGSTTLVGLILGGGTELDLSLAQSPTSKTGNTPVVPGEFASRLFVQLIRSFPYGCSTQSLTGNYGLIGTGFALASNGTQPVTVFASVYFDGNGNIVAQPVASGSPLASFQYSGTYTVNTNCTGTASFTVPAVTTGTTPTTGSTPATTVTASFVLIPPVAYVTTGTATLTGSADRPSLLFTTTNPIETISGYGRAQ
jgi:hypothetical protein